MITKNIDKEDLLTNGVRGTIVLVDEDKEIIWMVFPDDRVGRRRRRMSKERLEDEKAAVPIKKEKASFGFGNAGSVVRIQRTQYPVVPCFAITAHKCQGMTLSKVFVDFTDSEGKPVKNVAEGAFYVAITRVRTGEDLFLSTFSPKFIRRNYSVEDEMERLRLHAQHVFFKPFLNMPVFENNDDGEMKLVYLNINGFLHAEHNEDLKEDKNLCQADLLCISEMKATAQVCCHRTFHSLSLTRFRHLWVNFRSRMMFSRSQGLPSLPEFRPNEREVWEWDCICGKVTFN